MKKIYKVLISIGVSMLLFFIFCLNHITPNHAGIAYNSYTGTITVQTNAGWYVTSPFTVVSEIDLRPMLVNLYSPAKLINQKLVRFRLENLDEYLKIQGFDWAMGAQMRDILAGYVFSGQHFEFVEIIESPTISGQIKR